jgi:hypothetical protein
VPRENWPRQGFRGVRNGRGPDSRGRRQRDFPTRKSVEMIPANPQSDNPSHDGLLDLDQLIAEGMDLSAARAVLGGHSAVTRREALERWQMLQRARESRQTPDPTRAANAWVSDAIKEEGDRK